MGSYHGILYKTSGACSIAAEQCGIGTKRRFMSLVHFDEFGGSRQGIFPDLDIRRFFGSQITTMDRIVLSAFIEIFISAYQGRIDIVYIFSRNLAQGMMHYIYVTKYQGSKLRSRVGMNIRIYESSGKVITFSFALIWRKHPHCGASNESPEAPS